jgi:hypothetical protein
MEQILAALVVQVLRQQLLVLVLLGLVEVVVVVVAPQQAGVEQVQIAVGRQLPELLTSVAVEAALVEQLALELLLAALVAPVSLSSKSHLRTMPHSHLV